MYYYYYSTVFIVCAYCGVYGQLRLTAARHEILAWKQSCIFSCCSFVVYSL
jgi:hypothetical protein